MIVNKEMLLHSAYKSINEVGKLDAKMETEEEAYYAIGTAIHWLADCIERLSKKEKEENMKFKSLLIVNDRLKHNPDFEKAHTEKKGFMFPIQYPLKFDDMHFYVWGSLDNVKDRKLTTEQRLVYKNELENKVIYDSLIEIFEEVKVSYQDC